MTSENNDLLNRTIADFGRQWTRYQENDGYYASQDLFKDILGPLLDGDALKGSKVAEIGAGTGRIVNMLLRAGASHVLAMEPSDGYDALEENVGWAKGRVTCVKGMGTSIPASAELDYVFSIGVLHHIPDPAPTVKAAWRSLKKGGRIVIWLYGKEGNGLYLAALSVLRGLSRSLPEKIFMGLVWLLDVLLTIYISAARIVHLPLRGYMLEVIGKMTHDKRRLIIYDQLKPSYAKYYRQDEAQDLLKSAGFTDIKLYHRHGYSWTVMGTKNSIEQ